MRPLARHARSLALLAVAALGLRSGSPAAVAGQATQPDERAPAGLAGATPAELARLFREPSERLARLRGLEGEVRLRLALLGERWRERGWARLLGVAGAAGAVPGPVPSGGPRADPAGAVPAPVELPPEEPDLESLVERWRARGVAVLLEAPGDAPDLAVRAALAAALEPRVAAALLADWELDARELRAGLALLAAAHTGVAELSGPERAEVLRRCDLAAARLDALGADLSVLAGRGDAAPGDAAPGDAALGDIALGDSALGGADPELAAALAEVARTSPPGRRRTARAAPLLARVERSAERALATLARPRIDAARADELLRRAAAREEGALAVRRARALLPDFAEGLEAPPEVAALSASKRYAYALRAAVEGAGWDPFEPELAALAAHATSALEGDRAAVPWFDRYLALRGIRPRDQPTFWSRELAPEEARALEIVRRFTARGR